MTDQFILDAEFLDNKPSAIILSVAVIAVDFSKDFTVEDLKSRSIYVKFDAQSQKGRTVSVDTLQWWKQQDPEVQKEQLHPSDSDVGLTEGFAALRQFFTLNAMNIKNSIVWQRGQLDSLLLEDIAKQLNQKPLFPFYRVRDVRTAVDILSGSDNGYCTTTPPLPTLKKHHPISDCILDLWMLKYYDTSE